MEAVQSSNENARSSKRESFLHLKLFVKSFSGKIAHEPGSLNTSTRGSSPHIQSRNAILENISSSKFSLMREVPEDSSSSTSTPSPDVRSVAEDCELSPGFQTKLVDIDDREKWTVIQARGSRPAPRFNHAAAVVGRKLFIIGGETGYGSRNDVQMLHLGKLSWSKVGVGDSAPSNGLPPKIEPAQQLPSCKGHSLISWGKTVILIGGQMDPPAEKVAVWSFDIEMDCWTTVVTKGEIPNARRGQSVTRAGSILIMFGGEDAKGRKLNDLHILDLKSLLWLPLHPSGKGPSPRTRHMADMYGDRFLLIFGGETKSKISNDVYALDFDNMEWSNLKTKGIPPAPRAGHAGALVGDKWYIAGGESRPPSSLDTTVLDMSRMEWSVVVPASTGSVASLQGHSVLFVQRKEKQYLVAFGGYGTQASNAVHVLHIAPQEHAAPKTLGGFLGVPPTPDSRTSTPDSQVVRSQQGPLPALMGSSIPCACVNVAKTNLVSLAEHRTSSQRSISRSPSATSANLDDNSGLIPLRKRYALAQSSRMDPKSRKSTSEGSCMDHMTRRSLSQGISRASSVSGRRRDLELPRLRSLPSPGVAGAEGGERQHQSAQSIRANLQSTESTAPSVDSGLITAEDLPNTAPSVRPGLVSSVGDAGTLFCKSTAVLSSRERSLQCNSQSSGLSGYAETFVTGTREDCISNQSVALSTSSSDSISNMSSSFRSVGCQSSNGSSGTTRRNYEDDELTVLSKLYKADCAAERSIFIPKLIRHHERKLAAAIRKGELVAGQLAEALRSKEEAERTMHAVVRSRQQTERRLATALKQSKDLQERLAAAEQALNKSNDLVHHGRMDQLKLEFDLAVKNSVLEDAKMELQETKEVLDFQRTRALQLQAELFEAKQKLQSFDLRGRLGPCVQQPILA